MMNWGDNNYFSRTFPVFRAVKEEGNYSNPVIEKQRHNTRRPMQRGLNHKLTKSVFIGEKGDSIYETLKELDIRKSNVRFYPEGGTLVKGLPGRVAFTAYNDSGVNIDTDWMLTDEDGNPVGDNGRIFTVDGRGTFEVTPTGGELYLRMNGSMKKKESFMLPVPESEGCTMKADMLRHDSVRVAVSVSDSLQGRLLGYALMHNGKILTCDTITAREDFSLCFSRDAMPGGVNQLTLFDSSGRIRSERMMWIFPRQTDADSLKITTEMTRLSPCCKVELTLTARPESSLSFSAMDVATMTGGKEGNIRTWMLLGSELKGYVRDPEYYFESDDAEHRMNADLLMMIQGWRRYDWHLMSGVEKFKKVQPIEDRLYLFGNLKAYRKRNTVENVKMDVHLYNDKGQSLSGEAVTDSTGRYAFELPQISGEWNMHIFTRKKSKKSNEENLKTYYVSIDRRFSPTARPLSYYETRQIKKNAPNIFSAQWKISQGINTSSVAEDMSVSMTKRIHVLPTVKVKGRYFTNDSIVNWYNESFGQYWSSIYYDCQEDMDMFADLGLEIPDIISWFEWKNSHYANNPEYLYDNDMKPAIWEDTRYGKRHIINILNNKFHSKRYYNKDEEELDKGEEEEDKFEDSNGVLRDDYFEQGSIEEMPVFLDELKSVYISENPNASLRYIFVEDMTNPVTVFWYTIPTVSTESQKGLRKTTFQGYNVPSTFKTEDYTDLPPMEDFRRTIFWAPNVKTDKDGKAKIEFFNNSSCTQMYISAEGITKEGRFIVNE